MLAVPSALQLQGFLPKIITVQDRCLPSISRLSKSVQLHVAYTDKP